jgi:hypothetical protein
MLMCLIAKESIHPQQAGHLERLRRPFARCVLGPRPVEEQTASQQTLLGKSRGRLPTPGACV